LEITIDAVVELKAVEGLQVYVFAPLTFSVVDCPSQIVAEGEMVSIGTGLTVTVTCAVAVHPLKSPVTVYVIVEDGLAITLAPVVEFRVVAGLHEYMFAPPAASTVDCPSQIVTDGETVTTGSGLTVTVTCAVAVHPFRSPVMVYVVVEDGLAVTLAPIVALNAVDGLHAYEFAPPVLSVTDCPLQIVCEGETESTGSGFTLTVTWIDDVHPPMSPVTV
jgi:hypothetical protein